MCYKSESEKDQKNSTPVGQSSQNKTCAMEAQSSDDDEETLPCVKVRRTRLKGNLKKGGTEGSSSNDRVVYSSVCLV